MGTTSSITLRFLIAICAVSFVGEVLVHRHSYFALEATPFFFVFYGLACLAAALLIGALLAKLVTRPLDYYDANMQEEANKDG